MLFFPLGFGATVAASIVICALVFVGSLSVSHLLQLYLLCMVWCCVCIQFLAKLYSEYPNSEFIM